jgi:3-oxosteroid 1-dehydrogenase
MGNQPVIIIGGGIGGMTAAITAAEVGLDVTLVEKGEKLGGAAAYSGGQVWVPFNHVEEREGIQDSLDEAIQYVGAAAQKDSTSFDPAMGATWLKAASDAARYLEELGVIKWEIIPDYPDYYYPDLPGSCPRGRYLTGAPFDGAELGEERVHFHVSPHFPVGITYGEMFEWGGMSSKTKWDWDLVAKRRDDDVMTFGPGVAGPLFKGVLDRGVRIMRETTVLELISENGRVTGIRYRNSEGEGILKGNVILATGSHDWSREYSEKFTGIPPEDGGSAAPPTVSGDAISLTAPLSGSVNALPAWAAPVLPGYQLPEPAFPGDTGYRACFEHCLPHTFLVNKAGKRFADDSFHSTIVAEALKPDADGRPSNLPLFMIWDSQHHQKYGLGKTMPGGEYPEGLVTSAETLEELAEKLGIDARGLEETATRFSEFAQTGVDTDFNRGSNLSVRRFRGDWNNQPNPNLGAVNKPPFYGMRMRLLNSGIAAGGVRTDQFARVLGEDGNVIEGLYAVGECSARAAAGVGYNSGYSLSRAMAFGWIAARRVGRVNDYP